MLTRLTLLQLPLLGDLSEEAKQLLPIPTKSPSPCKARAGWIAPEVGVEESDIKSQYSGVKQGLQHGD